MEAFQGLPMLLGRVVNSYGCFGWVSTLVAAKRGIARHRSYDTGASETDLGTVVKSPGSALLTQCLTANNVKISLIISERR